MKELNISKGFLVGIVGCLTGLYLGYNISFVHVYNLKNYLNVKQRK